MKRTLLALLTLASTAGCSGGDTSCSFDEDCFRGEVCVDQVCQPPSDATNGNPNGAPNNNTMMSNNTTTSNNTTMSNNATNGPTNGSPNNTVGVCRADPFTAMCPSDDNDDTWEYLFTETGRGCLGGADDFEGGEFVLPDQTICPLEAVDKFNTNLIPCDNIIFVVEVTVTPQQDCDPADWDLNVSLQSNDCIEGNGKMLCETLPDGSKRATGFLEPSGSITSPYISITPLAENMRFDYDLKIVVRE